MNESWFRQLEGMALSMGPWPDERFPPSPYYRFLQLLASNLKPALSVELGLGGGGGSFHLAEGWPMGTVVGVEAQGPDDQQRDNWHFIQCKCPNFVLWRGDSVEIAPEVTRKHGRIDILFIDTVHTYEATMREWAAWGPHLSDRAVVCLDDLDRPGMDRAWEELPGRKLKLEALGVEPFWEKRIGGEFGVIWT